MAVAQNLQSGEPGAARAAEVVREVVAPLGGREVFRKKEGDVVRVLFHALGRVQEVDQSEGEDAQEVGHQEAIAAVQADLRQNQVG